MKRGGPQSFGGKLKAFREAAGYTQEELATIAGLSAHAISALERGERRRPHFETVRALSAALDLSGAAREALFTSARTSSRNTAVDELSRGPLPLPPTRMVGRENDVGALKQWFADPAARLITLVGPGGVGKTRLALEVARTVDEEGAIRVVFVPLAGIQDLAFVAPAIAEALGLINVTLAELPSSIRAACQERSTLLVLDNCEHLPDLTPLVADLLAATRLVRVLATSRASLRLRGERQYLVAPLAVQLHSDSETLADRVRAPAVRLFVERVRDVRPDFLLTSANSAVVTAICRRLDALPLAIELAAPWIKLLTVDELLHRLEHDVLISTSGRRDLPGRQQTMNATVAWSYGLLDSAEQRAFRRLGALPGRFPIEAGAAILGGRDGVVDTDEALAAAASLIDRSLLQRVDNADTNRPLYQMLETVRAYACLELSDAGEHDDAMEGLTRHYIKEASLAERGLAGLAQGEWMDRVRDEVDNYRAVLAWLIERDRRADAGEVAAGLTLFFLISGHTGEGLHWYRQILAGRSDSPVSASRALIGAGLMSYAKGELDRARADLLRVLAEEKGTAAAETKVNAENILGHVEMAAGNVDAAGGWYARSLDGYRALGVGWGIGNALSGMAAVSLAAGNQQHAERLLDEATLVLQQAGPWFRTPVLCFRAALAVQRAHPDEAIALMHESLVHIRALQDKFAFVHALIPLAAAAVLKGNHIWAARLLGARDAVAESMGDTIVDSVVQNLRERAEAEARVRLGVNRWDSAYAAGRTASIDALLTDIERAVR